MILFERGRPMKMISIATFALIVSAQSSFALDASDVLKCFQFRPDDLGIGAEADLRIQLDDRGLVTAIDVLRYQPDTEDGRRLAMSAAKAAQSCGPYAAGRSDVYLTIGPDTPSSDASIITMPDRADGMDDSLGNDILDIIGN